MDAATLTALENNVNAGATEVVCALVLFGIGLRAIEGEESGMGIDAHRRNAAGRCMRWRWCARERDGGRVEAGDRDVLSASAIPCDGLFSYPIHLKPHRRTLTRTSIRDLLLARIKIRCGLEDHSRMGVEVCASLITRSVETVEALGDGGRGQGMWLS
jgi:hypothetical protein